MKYNFPCLNCNGRKCKVCTDGSVHAAKFHSQRLRDKRTFREVIEFALEWQKRNKRGIYRV